MSFKTHSGAKKRFRVRGSGKSVKRRSPGMRHLNESKSSKRKRHLGILVEVNPSNMYQVSRQLWL